MSITTTVTSGRVGTRRAIALVATLGLLVPTATAWSNALVSPITGVLSLLLTGVLLVLAALIARAPDEGHVAELEPLILLAGVLALLTEAAASLPGPPIYATDGAGFLHAAALSLRAGHDPYAANLGWAIKAFGLQPTLFTNGSHVTSFAYPSLSLLVTLPVVALRSDVAAATVVEVASLAIAIALLYRALPERVRALAPLLCVALPALSGEALGGVSEVMLLPTLIVVAHRWRDVGAGGTLGRPGVLRAVALGLAVSTNQLAWFIVPFLLGGMVLTRLPEVGARGATRVVCRYACIAAGVFIVLNGPFFALNPASWSHDIFAAFRQPMMVPSGQGLPVELLLFAHLGGGNMGALSATVVLLYLAMLACYLLGFTRLHVLCFVLPSIALWFGDRSMVGYSVVPVVAILVSVLNGGNPPASSTWLPERWRDRPWLALGAAATTFVPAGVALAIALSSPGPLRIRLVSHSHRPGAKEVREVTITVTNRAHSPLVPHFYATPEDGIASSFWSVRSGPRSLAPGATATYAITPARRDLPELASTFWIEAVTADPETFSAVQVALPTAP